MFKVQGLLEAAVAALAKDGVPRHLPLRASPTTRHSPSIAPHRSSSTSAQAISRLFWRSRAWPRKPVRCSSPNSRSTCWLRTSARSSTSTPARCERTSVGRSRTARSSPNWTAKWAICGGALLARCVRLAALGGRRMWRLRQDPAKVVIVGPGRLSRARASARRSSAVAGRNWPPLRVTAGSIRSAACSRPSDPFQPARMRSFSAQSPHGRELLESANHLMSVNAVAPLQAVLATHAAGVLRLSTSPRQPAPINLVFPPSGRRPRSPRQLVLVSKVHGEECLALLQDSIELTIVRLFRPLRAWARRPAPAPKPARRGAIGPRDRARASGLRARNGGLRLSLRHVAYASHPPLVPLEPPPLRERCERRMRCSSIRGIAEAVLGARGQQALNRGRPVRPARSTWSCRSPRSARRSRRGSWTSRAASGETVAHALHVKAAPVGVGVRRFAPVLSIRGLKLICPGAAVRRCRKRRRIGMRRLRTEYERRADWRYEFDSLLFDVSGASTSSTGVNNNGFIADQLLKRRLAVDLPTALTFSGFAISLPRTHGRGHCSTLAAGTESCGLSGVRRRQR